MVILVAFGLPELTFLPGIPPPQGSNGVPGEIPSGNFVAADLSVLAIGRLVALILLLLLLVGLAVLIVAQRPWRSIPKILGPVFWSLLAVVGVGWLVSLLPPGELIALAPASIRVSSPAAGPALGPPPFAVILAVGILVLLALAFLMVCLVRKPKPTAGPLHLVGLHADKARMALLDGDSLKDVIVRCYSSMGRVFQDELGLERSQEMTTKEFEGLLVTSGAPTDSVHQLTELFEMVRYGRAEPSSQDKEAALECLDVLGAYFRCARTVPQ